MIPRPSSGDIPESPEKTGLPVRGTEPLPLLFATIEDMEELRKIVKVLGDKVKDLETRVRNLESEKI